MRTVATRIGDKHSGLKLASIFTNIGYTGLAAAAFIEFIPPALLLALHTGQVPMGMWLTLLIPLLVMVVTLPMVTVARRVLIANGVGLLLLVIQVLVNQSFGPQWFPYTFAVFAVGFGAAFSLPVIPALVVIVSAGLLNLIAVWRPTNQILLAASDFAGGTAGAAIVIIICGAFVGVAQGWRRTARNADERTLLIEQATEIAYQDAQVQYARTAIERRIHETILNTLNAISLGWTFDTDMLRRECRRDIEQLDLGRLSPAPQLLSDLVEEALGVTGLAGVSVHSIIEPNVHLPVQVATSLRDALVEVLRNVERHSRASVVTIAAHTIHSSVVLVVEDNGVGLSPDAQERFGVRNAIRASITAIGGSTVVSSTTQTEGTAVRMTVPLTTSIELQLPAEPALTVLMRPLSTRLFLLGGAVFGLLMLPWIAAPFAQRSGLIALAYLAFAAANVCLALLWNRRWRMAAAISVILTFVLLYGTTQQSIQGCAVAPAIHWLINGVGSCLSLLLFVSWNKRWNPMILPIFTGMGLWLMLSLPGECQAVIIMPLLSTFTYLAAAMYLIRVLLAAADRQRERAVELWTEATARRVEVAQQQEISAQWNRVSHGTRSLLVGLAGGEFDPREASVREAAAREESQLRANLGMRSTRESAIWQDLLSIAEVAAGSGLRVDVEVIEIPKSDRQLPQSAVDLLKDLVLTSGDSPISLRLFVDRGIPEVVCACKQEVADRVWARRFEQQLTAFDDVLVEQYKDMTISLEYMEDGLACVSLRQHPRD